MKIFVAFQGKTPLKKLIEHFFSGVSFPRNITEYKSLRSDNLYQKSL